MPCDLSIHILYIWFLVYNSSRMLKKVSDISAHLPLSAHEWLLQSSLQTVRQETSNAKQLLEGAPFSISSTEAISIL